jgi:hypothetical protein
MSKMNKSIFFAVLALCATGETMAATRFTTGSNPAQKIGGTAMAADIILTGARARPGYFAELEELEAARAKGTLEAYDLFLARHPDSRYAKQAKAERAKIKAGKQP